MAERVKAPTSTLEAEGSSPGLSNFKSKLTVQFLLNCDIFVFDHWQIESHLAQNKLSF